MLILCALEWHKQQLIHKEGIQLSAIILLKKQWHGTSRLERIYCNAALPKLTELTRFFLTLEPRRIFLIDMLTLLCENLPIYQLFHVLGDNTDPLKDLES